MGQHPSEARHMSPTTILAWDSPPRMDRSREGLRRRSGADLGDRLGRRGRIADEADQPDQGDQGRKQRQQPVVGQRRRPIAQVVLAELGAGSLQGGEQRRPPGRSARTIVAAALPASLIVRTVVLTTRAFRRRRRAIRLGSRRACQADRRAARGQPGQAAAGRPAERCHDRLDAEHLQDLFLGDLHDLLLVG